MTISVLLNKDMTAEWIFAAIRKGQWLTHSQTSRLSCKEKIEIIIRVSVFIGSSYRTGLYFTLRPLSLSLDHLSQCLLDLDLLN